MPRTNTSRVIGSEADLRRRIAYEREARGWSPAGLASRLTQAGCAIQQSAIWKIENSNRRITVDEHVALAEVFQIPLADLLVAPEIAASAEALAVLRKIAETQSEIVELADKLQSLYLQWNRSIETAGSAPVIARLGGHEKYYERLKKLAVVERDLAARFGVEP